MPLQPGTTLGSYSVTAKIGEGGMGEVYRARDTKLDRDVALKVLPQAFTDDPDRLARFEREAKVLASLNHPNIGGIHGLEESDGIRALVLEYIEGPTLADRIAQGPIPVDEALPIAKQIAEALEAAHEQGVIHRDLKPANIKVKDDGMVKVLDFGLAKALAGSGVSPDATHETTVTVDATEAGVVLGTIAYMSPEQARGRPVDRRADIWSFGCVLYEMICGRRPFAGATRSDTIAAVLSEEPDWATLPPLVPPPARRVLRRSLEKEPRRRLRDIGDALVEVEDVLAPTTPGDTAGHLTPSPIGSRMPWIVALAAVLAAVGLAIWTSSESRAADPLADLAMERVTYDTGLTGAPALAPDGQLLAYASDRGGEGHLDIWVQQPSGGSPLQLTDHPADDYSPHFSPDGSQIIFRSDREDGGAYVVSALGGEPRLVAPEARRPRFSPDGGRIAYWTGQFRGSPAGLPSQSYVMPLAGGEPIAVLAEFAVVRDAIWSPEGDALLVLAAPRRAARDDSFDWWWVPLDDRPAVKTGALDHDGLRQAQAAPSYWSNMGVGTSDGSNLWVVPLDPATGSVNGLLQQLTRGVSPHTTPTTSRDGQVAFFVGNVQRVVERVPLLGDTSAAPRPTTLYADSRTDFGRTSQTADGTVIVLERAIAGNREIWLRDLLAGEERLISRVEVGSSQPLTRPLSATVSPDGSVVAYSLDRAGYVVETSGGVPRQLCQECGLFGFLSDNRRVLARQVQGDTLVARLIDYQTGAGEDLLAASEGVLSRLHVSPDDRFLAFRWGTGIGVETFVAPVTPGHPVLQEEWAEVQEPTTTGRPTGWSLDSGIVYLLLDSDGFRCLWGQRIDPTTGALIGTPFAARHFHTGSMRVLGEGSASGFGTSYGNPITEDGFMYEGLKVTGNVWRLKPRDDP